MLLTAAATCWHWAGLGFFYKALAFLDAGGRRSRGASLLLAAAEGRAKV